MKYVLALALGSSLVFSGCCTKKEACPAPAAGSCCVAKTPSKTN